MSAAAAARAKRGRWPAIIVVAFVWVGLCVSVTALAPLLAPHDYQAMGLRARLASPALSGGTWNHALGTDELA